MVELSIKGMALAFGISFAFGALFLGITSWLFDFGTALVNAMGTVYVGYSGSLAGSLIGALWAFLDGAFLGVLVAYLYNKFQ